MSDWYGVRDAACPLSTRGGGAGAGRTTMSASGHHTCAICRGAAAPHSSGTAHASNAGRQRRSTSTRTTTGCVPARRTRANERQSAAGVSGVGSLCCSTVLRSALQDHIRYLFHDVLHPYAREKERFRRPRLRRAAPREDVARLCPRCSCRVSGRPHPMAGFPPGSTWRGDRVRGRERSTHGSRSFPT